MPSIDIFIAKMIEHGEKRRAAVEAGYSPKTAHVQATALLKRPKVAEALKNHATRAIAKSELSAERVLNEMRRLAFSDVRQLFDESGNLKPVHTLTDDQAACIAGLEVVKKNVTSGDGKVDNVIKVKVWDKPKVLEMVAKHFSLLTERIEHAGGMVLTWKDSEE